VRIAGEESVLAEQASRKFRDRSGARLTQQIASCYYQGRDPQVMENNPKWFGFLLFRNEAAEPQKVK
jgi:hypothetical protein